MAQARPPKQPTVVQRVPSQGPPAAPTTPASEGFPQLGELVIPLPKRPRKARPAPAMELAIPLPKTPRKRKTAPPIEEMLDPVRPTPPRERQSCLALMMQTAGHSLDWGCRLCFSNCVYAIPCGCGGYDCIDRKAGEPLVVFEESAKARKRGRKGWLRRAGQGGGVPRILRVFMPWTWFGRRKEKA